MRGFLLGVAALVLGVLAVTYGRGAPEAVRIARNDVVVDDVGRDDVRVEHEVVRLPSSAVETRRARPHVTQLTRGATRGATRERTLLAKARRLIVGNGRYRPQPFPTVRP